MLNPRHILSWAVSKVIPQAVRQKHTGFVHTGNPFETKIAMKRQVKDISLPNFKEQECLKWSTWGMLRDVKRRHISSEYWQYRNNLMSVGYCRTLPSVVREMAIEDRNSTPREASATFRTNRCAISARSRGKLIQYRLSRIIWRDMADHGLVGGAIRAKWG